MLQSKERKGTGKTGKGGKETGRNVKRKEKKGTTAIWSDIVCNMGWKCYPELESGILGFFCFQMKMYKFGRPGGHQLDGF